MTIKLLTSKRALFLTALFTLLTTAGGAAFLLPLTRANSILEGTKGLVLYSSSEQGKRAAIEFLRVSSDAPEITSDFANTEFTRHTKQLYLSPNREFVAVTVERVNGHSPVLTYIARTDGQQVTSAHVGSFISWAPDSSKVLLYLSGFYNAGGRRIYHLDLNDHYGDSGLPKDTINADISPSDGSIVYSVTPGITDNSSLYIRDSSGKDTLLLEGHNEVFGWTRFSPDGRKIAFMKSDLLFQRGMQHIWTVNPDATELEQVSDVSWNYPPVWSPTGSKLAFASGANIWEYDLAQRSLRNVTTFDKGSAQHPSYSEAGEALIFAADYSGESQVWASRNGDVIQLTDDEQEKTYPLLP